MKFRTFALALALVCGLTTIGEAKQKRPASHPAARKVRTGNVKPSKARKFKAQKFKKQKRVVAKRK